MPQSEVHLLTFYINFNRWVLYKVLEWTFASKEMPEENHILQLDVSEENITEQPLGVWTDVARFKYITPAMHHYSMPDDYDSTFHLTHLPNNWIKLNAHREFKGQLDLCKLGRFWKFSSKHWAHRLSSVCTDLKFSCQLLSMHEVSFSVETTYHTDHISLWMQHWKYILTWK